jgi:hypothetical protein
LKKLGPCALDASIYDPDLPSYGISDIEGVMGGMELGTRTSPGEVGLNYVNIYLYVNYKDIGRSGR